jgi:hypothetical protein
MSAAACGQRRLAFYDGRRQQLINLTVVEHLDSLEPYEAALVAAAKQEVYDRETHALIRNVSRASRSSQIPELQKNPDGSIDMYFGPKAPSGKESNWVPTDPRRGFELMFRLYGPKKEFFDKVWVLPDVEKVTQQS